VSTPPRAARPLTLTAGIATSAKAAKSLDTGRTSARNNFFQPALSSRPKYLRYNLWDTEGRLSPTIADWSESVLPFPRPPPSELNNTIVLRTLNDNPTLFQIVTPIDVDCFQNLLSNHPNPSFVNSVCTGLWEGFWPWANILKDGYPSEFDGS
jgi:hypothetical protein